jgi:hypothetical protein
VVGFQKADCLIGWRSLSMSIAGIVVLALVGELKGLASPMSL